MKDRTAPHLAAVYGALSESEGELVGSGTFLDLWGEPWLLSADHVLRLRTARLLDDSLKYVTLACSGGDGEVPVVLGAPCFGWRAPFDVAATPVLGPLPSDRHPLPARYLARSSAGVEEAILFVHGFTGAQSLNLSTGVVSRSLPYLSGPGGTSSATWFDPKVHFTVAYDALGLINERGASAEFVKAGGLSGAAVWAVNGYADVEGWSPERARVVGVATHWDQDNRLLIATRIEVVRELLLTVLRQRRAFTLWEGRGRPAGDDWSDWFVAVEEIEDLSLTTPWLRRAFADFDARFFGGRLASGTQVAIMEVPQEGQAPALEEAEHGACKKNGSILYVNPSSNHDWRCSLLHEMVHAFEYRFPDAVTETDEGRAAERRHGRNPFLGQHSARFFSKLFEVMRARGHLPEDQFARYFA